MSTWILLKLACNRSDLWSSEAVSNPSLLIYLCYAYICVYFMALDRKYIKFFKFLYIIESIYRNLHWIFGASLYVVLQLPNGCCSLYQGKNNESIVSSRATYPVTSAIFLYVLLTIIRCINVFWNFTHTDYVKGFGGKFGVQTDRQDKCALGWDHQEKVQLHESQKGISVQDS